MKTYIILIIVILISSLLNINSYGESVIPSYKASSHVGEYLTICGIAKKVVKLKKRTVINIGNNYPNEDINFLIWDDNANIFNTKFGNLNMLSGRNICASGTIEVYRNHLQIILDNPNTLQIK